MKNKHAVALGKLGGARSGGKRPGAGRPKRRRDIDRKLTARFCADRRANVRAAGETLAAMLDRHDRREFCEAKDIESIDTANFYLPAGLMIQWGK